MSNITHVYFDGLGIDFDLPSVAFSVFRYDIHWYGIIIAFGFSLAVLYGGRKAYKWKMSLDGMTDVLIWGTLLGIVCARLYYVAFEWEYYSQHLNEIPAIWNGGIAIYGGIIGALIGAAIGCKIGKIDFLNLLDLGSLGLLIGQGIGRWGNFFNQEVYGQKITDPAWQFFPFGVQIGTPTNYEWHQALFFYEGTLNFLLFLVLYITFWKARTNTYGYATGGYFVGYGIIRGVLEPLRLSEYNLPLFGMETSIPAMTLFSIILVLGGILLIVDTLRRDGKIKVQFVDKIKAKFAARKAVKEKNANAETTEMQTETPADEKTGEKTDEKSGEKIDKENDNPEEKREEYIEGEKQ